MKKSKTILLAVALFAVSGIVTGFTISTNAHKAESQTSLKSAKSTQSTSSKLGRTELDESQF